MKIAVVVHAFPVISETFVLEHVTGLMDRGHEAAVFCLHKKNDAVQHAAFKQYSLGHRTHNLASGSLASIGDLRGLLERASQLLRAPWRVFTALLKIHATKRGRALALASSPLCRKGRFHICHAHFAAQGNAMAWLRASGLMSCPLVVTLHGYDVTKAGRNAATRYPYLFQNADAIVVTTQFMADVVSAMGCPAEKLHRMPIGVALEQFSFRPRTVRADEKLRLLTVARLVDKKGVEFAIRAMSLLKKAGRRFEYSIVGDGPLSGALQRLAEELGVGDSVIFHGAQARAEVLDHYARCHLFVFPSCKADDGDQEGQGMVALEAQACGIPIVASRHGGIPEVVVHGETGLLVPERDPDALAAAIMHMAGGSDEWERMGRSGREWVERHFSLSGYLEKTEALYRDLLADAELSSPESTVGP